MTSVSSYSCLKNLLCHGKCPRYKETKLLRLDRYTGLKSLSGARALNFGTMIPCPDKTVPDKIVPNCKIFPDKTVPDKIVPNKIMKQL